MRPPPILLLQFLNLLAGAGTYLMICSGQGAWSTAGWSATTVAGVMVATNVCYGGIVAQVFREKVSVRSLHPDLAIGDDLLARHDPALFIEGDQFFR